MLRAFWRRYWFKRRDFILLQKGAIDKAKKDGVKEGLEKGLEKGIERGKQFEKFEMAQKMVDDHVSIETILKYTGLQRADVDQLRPDG